MLDSHLSAYDESTMARQCCCHGGVVLKTLHLCIIAYPLSLIPEDVVVVLVVGAGSTLYCAVILFFLRPLTLSSLLLCLVVAAVV